MREGRARGRGEGAGGRFPEEEEAFLGRRKSSETRDLAHEARSSGLRLAVLSHVDGKTQTLLQGPQC